MGKIKEKVKKTGRKVEQFCEDHFWTFTLSAVGVITGTTVSVLLKQEEAYKGAVSEMATAYCENLKKDSGMIEENPNGGSRQC